MTTRGTRLTTLKLVLPLVGLGALAVTWAVQDAGIDAELRQVSPAQRRALYQRTLDTLVTTCQHSTGPGLTDHCLEQAEFLARFPECDRSCQATVANYKPRPTR